MDPAEIVERAPRQQTERHARLERLACHGIDRAVATAGDKDGTLLLRVLGRDPAHGGDIAIAVEFVDAYTMSMFAERTADARGQVVILVAARRAVDDDDELDRLLRFTHGLPCAFDGTHFIASR